MEGGGRLRPVLFEAVVLGAAAAGACAWFEGYGIICGV